MDIFQLVCCYPKDADALTKSPWIRHITFIGSEEVGRKVSAVFEFIYNTLGGG